MRVTFVIASLSGGGAERVASNLANWLVRRGDSVSIVTLASTGDDRYPLDPDVQRIGLAAMGDSASRWRGLASTVRRIRRLRAAIDSMEADAVVAMMPRVNVLTLLATCGLGCRVVVSERTHPPRDPLGGFWAVARRLTYPWADAVVMMSRAGADWVDATIPTARAVVIPNAIAMPLADSEPFVCPDQLLSEQDKVLLAAGRLEAVKGFDLLLRAFAAAHQAHPAWCLVILGEGSLRDVLERQLGELGLEDSVRLPGWAGNMSEWYRRADLFVLSSHYEGFPSAIGEAMAHGVPAVSFDCESGPADMIRHEVDGVLVCAADADALATALGDLMGDDARRQALGRRAPEICDRFSEASVRALWLGVLEG